MLPSALLLVALLAVADDPSRPVQMADWVPLIERGALDEAQKTCEGWLTSALARTRAEAHKCLANVELNKGAKPGVETVQDPSGGGWNVVPGAHVDSATVKKAVAHLDLALKEAPDDLSVHKGRLDMLSMGGLYDEMAAALDQSAGMYRVGDTVGDVWLAHFGDLFRKRAYRPAIGYLTVLQKHYPDDHRVVGNLAAMYLQVDDYAGALPWAKKATDIAPDDVIDRVNLARIQHKLGKLDAAKREFDVAMNLPADADRKTLTKCWYADLLVDQHQGKKACRLQTEAGGWCRPSACPSEK